MRGETLAISCTTQVSRRSPRTAKSNSSLVDFMRRKESGARDRYRRFIVITAGIGAEGVGLSGMKPEGDDYNRLWLVRVLPTVRRKLLRQSGARVRRRRPGLRLLADTNVSGDNEAFDHAQSNIVGIRPHRLPSGQFRRSYRRGSTCSNRSFRRPGPASASEHCAMFPASSAG